MKKEGKLCLSSSGGRGAVPGAVPGFCILLFALRAIGQLTYVPSKPLRLSIADGLDSQVVELWIVIDF